MHARRVHVANGFSLLHSSLTDSAAGDCDPLRKTIKHIQDCRRSCLTRAVKFKATPAVCLPRCFIVHVDPEMAMRASALPQVRSLRSQSRRQAKAKAAGGEVKVKEDDLI